METSWLTANFVEQIHKGHAKGRAVNRHIEALTDATLAGLIEYGCLRRTVPDLPSLPSAITHSALGRELNMIVSEIGLRATGRSVPPSTDHAPREIEFQTVTTENELLSEPVQMMAMRITQRMKGSQRAPVMSFKEHFSRCSPMQSSTLRHRCQSSLATTSDRVSHRLLSPTWGEAYTTR
jgi:hypothetical protein